MKTFSFFLSFFLSFSLLGQCDIITDASTGLPSETPDDIECIETANEIIARHFAPNIYHMTDMASHRSVEGRADLITSVFYDVDLENVTNPEDLSTGNNWANLEDYSSGETEDIDALDPYVYYSVVWAENYWVIAYGFYHPRDWAGGGACCNAPFFPSDSHENDYEGAMFAVDRNTYDLIGAVTIFHGPLKRYSTTLHDLTNNPNVFIDDRTHAVEMNLASGDCIKDGPAFVNCDGCKEFQLGNSQNHILYLPSEDDEGYVNTTRLDNIINPPGSPPIISESRLYGEGEYILEDVFGADEFSLSNQRDNPFVFTGSANGSFYAATDENCLGGTASAPWGWGNFMHTRGDIEKLICFAETGDPLCYSVESTISSTPFGPVGGAQSLRRWPVNIEYNPYFPEQCGEETLTSPRGPIVIEEDTQWAEPENVILGDIIIDYGVTLTVFDRTLYFAPGAGIRIRSGGRLLTTGAIFDVCPQAPEFSKWRGIYAPLAQEAIFVHLTDGTQIKNAETGLLLGYRNRGDNGGSSPNVTVRATSFIDNNIGIHSFYTDNVHQIHHSHFINNNIGISLADGVEGLDIFETRFIDNEIGISAINSSVNITFNNTFNGGRIGILAGATDAMSSDVTIGSLLEDGANTFENLETGILAMGVGASSGLSILNNTFTNIQDNAVQIRGASEFTIANNSFGDDELGGNGRGIEVVGSGSTINRIQCNTFNGNEVVDNVFFGINNNTRFLENDFNSPDAFVKNIALAATLPDMGSASLSAANCFNDAAGTSPDIVSQWSNDFTYFYRNSNECQEQEPNSLSNILKEEANNNFNGCNGSIGPFNFIDPGNGNGGQVDINNFDADLVCKSCVLDSIEYYRGQIIANGGNNPETGNASVNAPTSGLVKKEQLFEQWGNFGLFVANERKDYGFAETILSPLNDWKWKTRYYGLSLQKEDFLEASNRLAALPNTDSNQTAFKRTQEVNLKYLTAKALGTESNISQEDIEMLGDIGLSYEPSNGYARTLLFILTGEELPTLIPELEEFIETTAKAEEKEESSISTISTNKVITIFPNPAKDHIQIKSLSKPIVRIVLTDIYGKSVMLKEGNDHSIRIEIGGISTGIYLVQLQLENGKLFTQKMIIDN